MAETSRLSAAEIFDRVTTGAQEELDRPVHNLAFSALAAGLAMGLSGLGVSVLMHLLGQDRVAQSVSWLGYPIGFLVVILGRMQLFTENTLFPVALVLETRSRVLATVRLWAVVLSCNLLGTLLFALLAVRTPAMGDGVAQVLSRLGMEAGSKGFGTVFWTAVVGGWMIALVAWLVTAATDTVGQLLVVVLLTFFVGVGHFAHSIAGSTEVLAAVVAGDLPLTSFLSWVCGAVLGNTVGGVVFVALLNYGQVHGRTNQERPGLRRAA